MTSEFVSLTQTMSPRVQRAFRSNMKLPPRERLTLAKLLLESVLTYTRHEEVDWMALGLESFQQDWDNADDAIYDEWREHCKRDAQAGVLPDKSYSLRSTKCTPAHC